MNHPAIPSTFTGLEKMHCREAGKCCKSLSKRLRFSPIHDKITVYKWRKFRTVATLLRNGGDHIKSARGNPETGEEEHKSNRNKDCLNRNGVNLRTPQRKPLLLTKKSNTSLLYHLYITQQFWEDEKTSKCLCKKHDAILGGKMALSSSTKTSSQL